MACVGDELNIRDLCRSEGKRRLIDRKSIQGETVISVEFHRESLSGETEFR